MGLDRVADPVADDWGSWLELHTVDMIALPITAAAGFRLWVAYIGVWHPALVWAALVATCCEIASRIVVAQRTGDRPFMFSRERRTDLLIAVVLMTGPWPIARVPLNDGSPLAVAWQQLEFHPSVIALAIALVLMTAAWRTVVFVSGTPRPLFGWTSIAHHVRGLVGSNASVMDNTLPSIDHPTPEHAGGVRRAMMWTRRAVCSHEYVRRSDARRMWLECPSCGHQTPGIVTATAARDRERPRPDAGSLDALVALADVEMAG